MTTRLGAYGGPRQPYGSFANKEPLVPVIPEVITRLGASGIPRQLYGDFSGKIPTEEEITRLGASGFPRQLYGNFTNKEPLIPVITDTITRLGLYGGPRSLYGDFSGKREKPPRPGGGGNQFAELEMRVRQEDEEIMLLISTFLPIINQH